MSNFDKDIDKIMEETHEAHERTQIMLDAMPLCCNFWNDSYVNIDCNQAALSLFGVSGKREYLERFLELSPEYQPDGGNSSKLTYEYVSEAFETGYKRFEWMHRTLDGQAIPSEITLVRVKWHDSFIVVGYTRDLRELLHNIEKMREADERTRLMLDATPLCCNLWDRNFNNIDCNEEAVKLFELSSKQEYLERFLELSPPYQPNGRRSDEMASEFIKTAFEHGYSCFEWMHRKLNGEPVPSEITLVRVKWRGDYIVAGYTRDMRELRKAVAILDSERALSERILDTSPISYIIVEGKTLRRVNPFAAQFLGMKVGDKLTDYLIDPLEDDYINKSLDEFGEMKWYPISMKTRQGERKEVITNIVRTDYYGAQVRMAWVVDLTDIRAAEKEMLRAKELAEQNVVAKNDFLANMSHELKTPMNAIIGMMHLLKRSELSDKQRNFVENAAKAADGLMCIITEVLDYSKIDDGKTAVELVDFTIDTIFSMVWNQMSKSAADKGLDFTFENNINLTGYYFKGDPKLINQVLTKLVSNAVKFTEKGAIKLSTSLAGIDGSKVHVCFAVSDTGIGIDPNQTEMLFEPFTQADTSTTRKYGGTGLGLAFCKKLSNLLGGKIYYESEPGAGSTFYLEIPLEFVTVGKGTKR